MLLNVTMLSNDSVSQYIVHTNVVLYNVGVMFEHSYYTCERIIICTNTIRIMDDCALFSPSYFSGYIGQTH